MVFAPQTLVRRAQERFVDSRFVRNTDRYVGSIVIYHIVRERPYSGSLTQWLKARAESYEKKHKGTYIEIEGMDEEQFYERLEHGRRPDAYSFFSGTLYPDRLLETVDLPVPFREGLFRTDRCTPYCYSGYCKLIKNPDRAGGTAYCANDILAARTDIPEGTATEDKADVLYLDLRRAGDLIRYKEGFALSVIEPIDNFTEAVCWLGIDRETDGQKAEAIESFLLFLLEPDSQRTLNALGLFSVRSDIKNTPPVSALKHVFRAYESIRTVDPFKWHQHFDALSEDAALARKGNADAKERFAKRLTECCR